MTRRHQQRHRRASAPRVLALLAVLGVGLAAPRISFAADPFYEEQFRRGRRAYEIGQFEDAAKALRIAAFGLLDEPEALVESLLYLGLSQAGTNDTGSFDVTFERIVDLQDRFAAYERLDRPQIKAAFEAYLVRWLAPERLRVTPGFERLVAQESSTEVELRPAARRRALQRVVAQNPADLEALLELARLELQQGRERKSLASLEQISSIDPANAQAHCLRVAVAAAMKRCDLARASYQLCGVPSFGPATDLFVLTCLVGGEDWNASREFLADLPAPQRATASFVALEARVVEELPAAGLDSAPTDVARSAEMATGRGRAPAEQGAKLSPEDIATANRVRELLDAARQPQDLDEPIRLATDLAAKNPETSEAQFLAAEAAYRGGRWEQAVEMFRRGGKPSPTNPLLVFYFAVSLYESGEGDRAAEALRSVLPALRRTAFVDSYADRILGE